MLAVSGTVIASILLILGYTPRFGATITDTYNDANITFQANTRFIMHGASCHHLRWETNDIAALKVNERPLAGTEDMQSCGYSRTERPTMTVEFPDGATRTYQLPLIVLTHQPIFWIAAVLSLVLLIAAAVTAITPTTPESQETQHNSIVYKQRTQSILLTLFGVLFAFGMAELLLRVWINTTGNETDKLIYLASPSEIASANTQFTGYPFINYGLNPANEDVNSLGFRGEEITVPKPDDVYRIITLGGSTTYGLSLDPSEAWPARLQQTLRTDYGYDNVEVVNLGVPAYTTWHSLVNFQMRGLELEPDLVIVYHAVNDAVRRTDTAPDCFNGQNALRGLSNEGIWQFREPELSRSALLRYAGINLGFTPNPAAVASQSMPAPNACDPSMLRVSSSTIHEVNTAHFFERNLRSIIGVARIHNVDIMLSTWTYSREGVASEPNSNYLQSYIAPLQLTDEHNTIIRAIAAEEDILLFDLDATLPDSPDYWQVGDWFHQTRTGTTAQATLYAEYLHENDIITD